MALAPRQRLGVYEVTGALGAGAMGEVYRARDSRLGRDVALKILPAEYADSLDRRRRFEQESRAASALNHPNIVAVYDVGSDDGISYIVSELVEGESLRDLIRRGAVPVRKALGIAAQIADGLAAAHAAGVVHRDLKPENIMLSRDGRPKILDFGLARYQPAVEAEGTMTTTQPGVVMGTVGYMSPEHVTGAPADARSDIFSLGVILFEMLTGRIAFERATSVETMSAILRDEPAEIPATVPAAVQHIVLHCLEKEPLRRFQSAHDLAFNIRTFSEARSSIIGPAPKLPDRRSRWRLLWVAALFAALLLGVIAVVATRPPETNLSAYRFTPFATESDMQDLAAWSPDGKSVAYSRVHSGATNEILVRSLDSQLPVLVAKADASSIMWSADGTRLYYVTGSGVWSVSRAGGEPVQLCKGNFMDAALSPDGNTLVLWLGTTQGGGKQPKLWISSPPGAALRKYEPVVFEEEGSFAPIYLRFSPDGRKILLTMPTSMASVTWLLPFPDGPRATDKARRIFQSTMSGSEWPPAGGWMPDSRHFVMSLAPSHSQTPQLWMADIEKETMVPLTADEGQKMRPSVSPDGRRIAYSSVSQNYDLVEIPVSGGEVRPLLATSRDELYPAWSPQAAQFAYVTNRNGPQEIWVRNAQDGSERPVVTQRDFVNGDTVTLWALAFSPDGRRLAYARNSKSHLGAIWISPVEGGPPIQITTKDETAFSPSWSPDGNWLLFFSSAGGLMKARVGSSEPPVLLHPDSCRNPAQWSPDGQTIACAENDGGVSLLTQDGKQVKKIGTKQAYATWSRDGKELYLLVRGSGASWQLDAVDVKSGAERMLHDLGSSYIFSTLNGSSFPLSLSADGKTLATSAVTARSNIWLFEGFPQPRRWW